VAIVDLFDRQIDSIRSFDPETQRSTDRFEKVELLPAREFSLSAESIKEFRRRFRTRFEGDLTRMSMYRDVGAGLAPAGSEYYLPLFHESSVTLLDFLPRQAVIVLPESTEATLAAAWDTIEERYEERRYDIEHPVLAPGEIFATPDEWLGRARQLRRVQLVGRTALVTDADSPLESPALEPPPTLRLDQRRPDTIRQAAAVLRDSPERVLLAAESPGRRELLIDLLRPYGLTPRVVSGWDEFLASSERLAITVAPLASGLTLPAAGLTIIAEEQLFGERAQQERRRRRADRDPARIIQQLAALRPGAPVVHEDYGIGRYRGLVTMDVGGMTAEFLLLEYAGDDKLYVPVQSLERVSRYTGAPAELLSGRSLRACSRSLARVCLISSNSNSNSMNRKGSACLCNSR